MAHQDHNVAGIGAEMRATGLPASFVARVLELAQESEGVEDLVHLWAEAPDAAERREVEADLQGMIEDREPSPTSPPVRPATDAAELLAQRVRQKEHLRRLIDDHGGVSQVARRAEMPQPSLSRLLHSMSEPRASTLQRLANAMGISRAALSPRSGGAPEPLLVGEPSHEGYATSSASAPAPPLAELGSMSHMLPNDEARLFNTVWPLLLDLHAAKRAAGRATQAAIDPREADEAVLRCQARLDTIWADASPLLVGRLVQWLALQPPR